MSEAITKACETCDGTGTVTLLGIDDDGPCEAERMCHDCSGTGRVPDEVATLRAQLDAARAEVERLLLVGREHDLRHAANSLTITDAYSRACADNDRLRAEVERLTALYRKADDGHDENMRETARLIREVERLTAREREAVPLIRELRGVLRDYLTCQACERCVQRDAHIDAWLAECAP